MKKIKILIIENDEDERYFMKKGFELAPSFDVMAILNNGDSLIRWLESAEALPELIVSDLNMPGKNGFDILEYINNSSKYRHIPVIIISTSSTDTVISNCMEAGAAAFMPKPDTFIRYDKFAEVLYKEIDTRQLLKPSKI